MSSFRFTIKQQWTIEQISIFSNSSHLEWRAGLSDTILKGTHPRIIPARFGLTWFRGFREEDLNVKVYKVRQTTSDGKSSHGLWPGELKINQAKKHLHNTHPLSGNIKFICSHFKTEKEKLAKDSPFFLFLKLVQINIIFATMYVQSNMY